MDRESKPRPIVIFYDCCIPKKDFRKIIEPVVLFAEHHFVREDFPEETCRDDYKIFSGIEKMRQKDFPDKICFLVTSDGDFEDQVKRHPVLGETVKFIKIGPSNSHTRNRMRAREAVHKILEEYMNYREECS